MNAKICQIVIVSCFFTAASAALAALPRAISYQGCLKSTATNVPATDPVAMTALLLPST